MPTHACISSGRIFMLHRVKNCVTACKISYMKMARVDYFLEFYPRKSSCFSTSLSTTREIDCNFKFFFSSLAQMAHLCLEIRNCEITARVELLLFLHFSFYIIVIMAHGNINYNNNNNSSDDPAVLLSTL